MVWENAVHSENHNDVEAFEVRMLDEIFYAGSRRRGQRSYVMPNLTVVIPDSLASILNNAVARRATSPDSVVTAALSEYFQSGRHRAYQVFTSAGTTRERRGNRGLSRQRKRRTTSPNE